jgi:hypothetical protein
MNFIISFAWNIHNIFCFRSYLFIYSTHKCKRLQYFTSPVLSLYVKREITMSNLICFCSIKGNAIGLWGKMCYHKILMVCFDWHSQFKLVKIAFQRYLSPWNFIAVGWDILWIAVMVLNLKASIYFNTCGLWALGLWCVCSLNNDITQASFRGTV